MLRHHHRNGVASVMVYGAVALVTMAFMWLSADILWQGFSGLSWDFITTVPKNAGRSGGILSVLVSTLLILSVCMAVALPLGLGTAVFLAEFAEDSSIFGILVRRSLDVLAGVPSIVFGLFGYAFFCKALGLGFSILAGGLTLSCMALPILIRSVEQGFRALPHDYRVGAAALGLSKTSTLIHLLLPAAAPALLVGFVLGIGRALAETAALIFTSGYVDRMPSSVFDSGRSLSIHIYDLSMNVPGGNRNAYASALVLLVLLLLINSLAGYLMERFLGKRILR